MRPATWRDRLWLRWAKWRRRDDAPWLNARLHHPTSRLAYLVTVPHRVLIATPVVVPLGTALMFRSLVYTTAEGEIFVQRRSTETFVPIFCERGNPRIVLGAPLLANRIVRDDGKARCQACGATAIDHFYTSLRDGQRLCPACFAARMEAGLAKEGTMDELPFTVTYESHREIRVKLAQEYPLNDLKDMGDQIIDALNEGFFKPPTPHDPPGP